MLFQLFSILWPAGPQTCDFESNQDLELEVGMVISPPPQSPADSVPPKQGLSWFTAC